MHVTDKDIMCLDHSSVVVRDLALLNSLQSRISSDSEMCMAVTCALLEKKSNIALQSFVSMASNVDPLQHI